MSFSGTVSLWSGEGEWWQRDRGQTLLQFQFGDNVEEIGHLSIRVAKIRVILFFEMNQRLVGDNAGGSPVVDVFFEIFILVGCF